MKREEEERGKSLALIRHTTTTTTVQHWENTHKWNRTVLGKEITRTHQFMQHKNKALCCNRVHTASNTLREERKADMMTESLCVCMHLHMCRCMSSGPFFCMFVLTAAHYRAAVHDMKKHLMKRSIPLAYVDPQHHTGKTLIPVVGIELTHTNSHEFSCFKGYFCLITTWVLAS